MKKETTEKPSVVEDKRETTGSVPDEFRIAMRYAFSMGYLQGNKDTHANDFKWRGDHVDKMAYKMIDEAFAKGGATHLLLPL